MLVFSKTDIGKVRSTNQDACISFNLPDGTVFVLVCDGMGGANAGNIASKAAVESISEYVKKSYRTAMTADKLSSLLKNAVISANIELYDMSLKNIALSGMGTTVVAAIVRAEYAVICNVGDSRAYLISDSITQITRDHSVVQSLIESGKLTLEEAKYHPRKNIITRALGTEEEVIPDCYEQQIVTGDTLLLCSDGLTNFVDVPEILNIFNSNDIAEVTNKLIDSANSNGGGDNITVITVTA